MKNADKLNTEVILDAYLGSTEADELNFNDDFKFDFDEDYLSDLEREGLENSDTDDFDDDDFGGVF